MSFKVGDTIYWLCQNTISTCLLPEFIEIIESKIVNECYSVLTDIHYYEVDNQCEFVFKESSYKSKQDCIEAFKERLDEL
ncbi:hypothetical protein YTPLAS21_19350 [Candidatus Nitrosocosmicus sp.]|nr:hypothetical protein YTPLAS21_19350 [Candidatus Nitrosocosmicus sp.]